MLASFDFSHVTSLDPGEMCEGFLGDASARSGVTNRAAKSSRDDGVGGFRTGRAASPQHTLLHGQERLADS